MSVQPTLWTPGIRHNWRQRRANQGRPWIKKRKLAILCTLQHWLRTCLSGWRHLCNCYSLCCSIHEYELPRHPISEGGWHVSLSSVTRLYLHTRILLYSGQISFFIGKELRGSSLLIRGPVWVNHSVSSGHNHFFFLQLIKAGIAYSLQRLVTGWTTEGSELQSP
jgi:hypothetical protein